MELGARGTAQRAPAVTERHFCEHGSTGARYALAPATRRPRIGA
jgi:hypothetical protein